MTVPVDDGFAALRRMTRARIGLGRAGDALPNAPLLAFQMAHAKARDAVHGAVDLDRLTADLAPHPVIRVESAALDRATYLRRPDLGRRLAAGAAERLPAGPFDVAVVIGDGLSAAAVDAHGATTALALIARLGDLTIAPIVVASGARVALGDPIGAALGAEVVVMLIGERPGLSAADSLGAYLTFQPVPGRRDSERNCVSNIHGHGLSPAAAADKLAWLVREARRLGLSGVELKEDSPSEALTAPSATALPGGA
ncbi:ethanolamine ammonia-lyase subunit EutC [Siculibacillus lacustris]|uniref:Ethanolamine ammonia-lyase small subunit n=1 Tax=Siculibacillus lacustris TaxID=1549641 RepID=A0A4Q9VJG9_9HYPH|nr:ethanolamine ammonia-lyase subunit EutC [Siculibacillus lacustris]TBW35215.1 ethanolamine ammonia-lyase subunit EutC [Siculibacillus lacustris]